MNDWHVNHPIVVDDRTQVRAWGESDADALYEQLLAERDSLFWNSIVDGMRSAEDVRTAFLEQAGAVRDGRQVGGAIEFDGCVAGQARITHLGPLSMTGNLGYWLFGWARGKGLATTTSQKLIEVAFTIPRIESIEIGMATINGPSKAVAGRLGATFMELRRGAITRRAREWDAYVYRVRRPT
jgi:ribosomal-protein-serine acetyltransferase